MKHATVNKDGYNVPLIGVAEEAVLEECDCCHEQHALLDLTWTGTQTLCAKCADQQGGVCDGSPNDQEEARRQ